MTWVQVSPHHWVNLASAAMLYYLARQQTLYVEWNTVNPDTGLLHVSRFVGVDDVTAADIEQVLAASQLAAQVRLFTTTDAPLHADEMTDAYGPHTP